MAQEHQEYIQQKVNPILENLVTQLLLERPENLAPFMIKWLSEHAKTPAALALAEGGSSELSTLKAELAKLQEEVQLLEDDEGGQAATNVNTEKKDEDSEEEEDDDDEEDLPPPPASYMKKERQSVSAEAYGAWNVQNKDFTPPNHPKTDEQRTRIRSVLQKSWMFKNLDDKDMGIIIGAMVEKVCEKDARIIEQGDDGDCLFVVEAGSANCTKKIGDEEKLLKVCKAGDAFGELALLYNTPRACAVIAAEDKVVLWQLDRETFNHIVRDAAQKRRERYEDFLKKVPILETMEAYERLQMCDALQVETFSKGDKIVEQGQPGDKFYILEEGTCVCMKVYASGSEPQEVLQYKAGDYFGELALLNNETRAATVLASSDGKLVTLTGPVFKALLGPLEDILKRKSAEYK